MNNQSGDLVATTLRSVGAVITGGHFVYTSGLHGGEYIDKDALYLHPRETQVVCNRLAARCASLDVDVVIAPAIGGVILTHHVALELSALTGREVLAAYAEPDKHRHDGMLIIRATYAKRIVGKRVLVLEDSINTGGSVEKVISVVRKVGGQIIGVGAVCNRGQVTAQQLGVPVLHALMNVELRTYEESVCPYCANRMPVNTEVGKGRDYLAKKAASERFRR